MMRYQTKLYFNLVATAVISGGLGISITYYHVKKIVLNELHSKITSVAAAAAAAVDRNQLQQVQLSHNENSAAYQALQLELRKIRDNNRRDDIYVKSLYIIAPTQPNKRSFSYLVDAEDRHSPNYSHLGQPATEAKAANVAKQLMHPFSPTKFVSDEGGEWLVGYAPIDNLDGKYMATLGVNFNAALVIKRIHRLIIYGVSSLTITILIALVCGWFLARRQSSSLQLLQQGVRAIENGQLDYSITIASHDEFAELATDINHMARGLLERERLRFSFTRYVSHHIMESILKTDGNINLAGERRKITILFSDIRQFTKLAEQYNAETVVSLLNEYFSIMVDVVYRNGGVLDKFLGDGIMVEFGAPIEDEQQEYHALNAALEMCHELELLCNRWKKVGKPQLRIGIGIHTGIAVIGNIGSEQRVEYTAIGDSVNIAARLEQLTKQLDVPILISATTAQAVEGQFNLINLGSQVLRNRSEPITVYTVIPNKPKQLVKGRIRGKSNYRSTA